MAIGTYSKDIAVEPSLPAIGTETYAIAVLGLSNNTGTGQGYLKAVTIVWRIVIDEPPLRMACQRNVTGIGDDDMSAKRDMMSLGDGGWHIGHRARINSGIIMLCIVEITVRDLVERAEDVTDDGTNVLCATLVSKADGRTDDDTVGNGTVV